MLSALPLERYLRCIAFACSERSFVISSLSARIAMPNSRRWQQNGVRRGWKVHEELQQQAWLRVLQGRRPPSVQWPRAGAQQPERFGVAFRVFPVNSCEPDASSIRGKFEGGQDRAVHGTPRPRRHNRVEVSPGFPRQGPSPDGSAAPSEAGGRLSSILHTGSPTIGEGARRSGGRSRDGGQVRGRVARRIAEVGRPQGCHSSNKSSSSGSCIHHLQRPGRRSLSIAGRSDGVDSGAGQPSFTSSTNSGSRRSIEHFGRGAGPAGRVFRSDGNTHRRSRFRSSTDARPVPY